ncbi:DUF2384 domain-containing protein [Ottowia sp. GY511]|uniref:Antitoxin Xre-like helix-turn-helix domain-containing protein n=1 Tax=Ottowia flava TaxID=2675430 RepID=A0ABW4KU88_9BURK|nr:antitoxin Xre-like helix-turn-helix domain-containing protein [Ottowia sp. GY511]TXK33584.1 DUF2384 domain-containing protein [Ottowia sp. GY511]
MPAAQTVQVPSPDRVLTQATLRAADLLALPGSDLAKVIGVSDSTVSRYRSGAAEISPSSKPGELALLLVRVFRSLDPLVGSDTQLRKEWMHSLNKALGGVPAQLVLKPDGLTRTLSYLDGMRAAA